MNRRRFIKLAGLALAGAAIGGGSCFHFGNNSFPALKCALHVHTTASDGLLSDEVMIAAYARAGYDVVAITDHDHYYTGKEGVREVCGRKILVLAGQEHSERVPGTDKPCHVIIIHGVRILAHPRFSGLTREDFAAVLAQYYERYNSTCNYPRPGKPKCAWSRGFEDLGKLPVYSDDAHCANIVGIASTTIRAKLDVDSVVAALKAGKIGRAHV